MDAERQAPAPAAEAQKDIALIRAVATGQLPPWEDHNGAILRALCRRYVAGLDDGR